MEIVNKRIVHRAKNFPKKSNFKDKIYIGISSLHRQSFNNLLLWNQTASSEYYWKLKDPGLNLVINLKIILKILPDK